MGRTIKIQLSDEQRDALENTYRNGANHALRVCLNLEGEN